MTDSTLEMLTAHIDSAVEAIAEYAHQIESGEYGNRWTVTDEDGNEYTTLARDEDDALARVVAEHVTNPLPEGDLLAERDEFDEPTICDEDGNTMPIYEWPLSVEVRIGRPLAVTIATGGGPHIEIAQDLSNGRAKLAGYWGREQVYRYGDEFQTVLDYFTDPLRDEAPEEYK